MGGIGDVGGGGGHGGRGHERMALRGLPVDEVVVVMVVEVT